MNQVDLYMGNTKAQTNNRLYQETLLTPQARYHAESSTVDQATVVERFRSWVAAAVDLNSQKAASVPLRLYVRKSAAKTVTTRKVSKRRRDYLSGETKHMPSLKVMQKAAEFGDDFEEVVEMHPAIKLLQSVNPFMNGYNLAQLRFTYMDLVGNAYLHPIMGSIGGMRRPVELWPILSQFMRVVPGGDFVKGYEFGNTVDPVKFAVDEIIHFKTANPRNMYYGIGKVEKAWGIVQVQESKRNMDVAFFKNQARPDFILTAPSGVPLNKEQVSEYEHRLRQITGGVNQTGRFVVLGTDFNITPLNFPAKDLGDPDEVVEEIAAVMGVPVSLLKANDPNLASASVGFSSWNANTIHPMLVRDEQELNESYLPLWEAIPKGEAFLAYDNPVPEDKEFEVSSNTQYVSSGVMTINEVRASMGLEDIEGGDVLRVNGSSVESLDNAGGGFGGFPFSFAPSVGSDDNDKPDPQPEPQPKVEEMPDNIEATMALNGAQITAAKDVLGDVAAGLMSELVAIELLIALGIDPERAKKMVESAKNDTPKPAVVDPPKAKAVDTTPDDEDEIEGFVNVNEISHKSLMLSEGCTCHDDDDYDTHTKTYHAELCKADAEDDIREGEPDAPHRRLSVGLSKIMAKYRDQIVTKLIRDRGLPSKVTDADIQRALKELDGISDAIKSELAPEIRRMLATAGGVAINALRQELPDAEISVSFDELNPTVREAAEKQTVRLAGNVSDDLNNRVSDMVREGLEKGETVGELTKRIREDTGFSKARAETIARTEMAQSYVDGQEVAWRESGVVQAKQWRLAPNACEFCEAVAKQFNDKPVPLGEAFYQKGDTLTGTDGGILRLDYRAITGPPLHPNDRCNLKAVRGDT